MKKTEAIEGDEGANIREARQARAKAEATHRSGNPGYSCKMHWDYWHPVLGSHPDESTASTNCSRAVSGKEGRQSHKSKKE